MLSTSAVAKYFQDSTLLKVDVPIHPKLDWLLEEGVWVCFYGLSASSTNTTSCNMHSCKWKSKKESELAFKFKAIKGVMPWLHLC